MDASTGATNNGNGHADPSPESLPSAAVVPGLTGAPVSSAPQAPAAGAPDDVRDPATGKIKPGRTLNPKGRTPGIPNKNTEFLKLLTSKQLSEVWTIAKKQASKGDVTLLQFLLERVLVKLTPEAAGIVINNNPQTHLHETNVRIGEHLADERTREAVAQLTERLGARGVFSGRNGNGN